MSNECSLCVHSSINSLHAPKLTQVIGCDLRTHGYLFTCLLVWGTLPKLLSKLELSVCLFNLSLSFFGGSTIIGPRPRNSAVFLVTALVRRPVEPAGVIRGVFTTSEEIDLSFLLAGNVLGDSASSALTFFLLNGKIFALTSCRL
jgi:hypothetical protein